MLSKPTLVFLTTQGMKQLFKKLVASETGAGIDKHGELLVAKYKRQGRSKQTMAAEEIQALIDERDDALRKVQYYKLANYIQSYTACRFSTSSFSNILVWCYH